MPIRTCLVTGEKLEQSDLLRFAVRDEQLLFIEQKMCSMGRSGYVKKDPKSIEKLANLGGKICHFLKVKKVNISEEVIERMKTVSKTI